MQLAARLAFDGFTKTCFFYTTTYLYGEHSFTTIVTTTTTLLYHCFLLTFLVHLNSLFPSKSKGKRTFIKQTHFGERRRSGERRGGMKSKETEIQFYDGLGDSEVGTLSLNLVCCYCFLFGGLGFLVSV